MHGKTKLTLNDFMLRIYPTMEESLVIKLGQVQMQQSFNELTIILKSLMVTKNKLHKSETLLLYIPQIEIIFTSDHNPNHYLHYSIKSKKDLKMQLLKYNTLDTKYYIKVNLASFYNANALTHKETDSIKSILAHALSPYIHYQLSYIPLLHQIFTMLASSPLHPKIIDKRKILYKAQIAFNDV